MEKVFLDEYFFALFFFQKGYEITTFKQKEGETLSKAQKRFKKKISWMSNT